MIDQLMIDLETMGNGSDAAIVQIGACFFDIKTGEVGRKFSVNVDLASSMAAGLTVTASTIEWWMRQSDAARDSILALGSLELHPALIALRDFCEYDDAVGPLGVWSHATFDFVILANAAKAANMNPLFNFRVARDIRTVTALGGGLDVMPEFPRTGTHHNALDDCLYQVQYVSWFYRKINGLITK